MPNLPWNIFEPVLQAIRADNDNPVATQVHRPVILGAGLAGCWLARTLAERGVSVTLIDQHDRPARGASSNPAGIFKPFVTRAPCPAMQFYASAHDFLLEQLRVLNLTDTGFHPCGVAQLVYRHFPQSRQYQCLNTHETDLRVGHKMQSPSIYFAAGGWLNPAALCQSLIAHPLINLCLNHKVNSAVHSTTLDKGTVWTLSFARQQRIDCTHLVLTNGENLAMLPETRQLPIEPARGQLSRFELDVPNTAPRCVISGKQYVIPDGKTILVGASFERGSRDSTVLPHEHEQNHTGLKKLLPVLSVNPVAVQGYAGVRATTPDRLPLIGPMHDVELCKHAYAQLRHGNPNRQYAPLPTVKGLYVLGGFGSRGIVTAPLGAKLLVDLLMNDNSMEKWASLVNPARFLIRQLKRGIADSY